MDNFVLSLPTKLYFGEDEHLKIGNIVKDYGFRKVLLMYGQNSVIKTGILSDVVTSLVEAKIHVIHYGGISPNPEIKYVREALRLAKDHKVDLLLALGGGSVIDVAKIVSIAYDYEGDPLDFLLYKVAPSKALPLGVILTHASAGSEMSSSSVISEAEKNFKQGLRSDLIRPLFAVTNPKLTYTVSAYQTAIGIVDSLMHSLERYFCASPELSLSDRFAEGIFITLFEAAKILNRDPSNYEARANVMLASTMSHNDITGLGKKVVMSAHALEHALSALYPHIPHGHGLAIIWPAWAKFYIPYLADKFNQLGRNVFKIENNDKIAGSEQFIELIKARFVSLGLSLTLSSVGVKKEDIPLLADIVTKEGTKKVYHPAHSLTRKEVIKIYESCY